MNCDSIFHNLVIKQPSALPSNMSNIGRYWAILGDIGRYWATLGPRVGLILLSGYTSIDALLGSVR